MASPKLVSNRADGTQEIRIGSKSGIQTPIYSPEIGGPEDLEAILNHIDVLDNNNPIFVPGFRWKQLRKTEQSGDMNDRMETLVNEFPIIMYEPPELFRFSLGGKLVTYALKGSRSQRSEFNSNLKNGRVEESISLLPIFFRDFVRCQISKIYKEVVARQTSGPDKVSEVTVPQIIRESELNLSPPDVWKHRISESVLNDYFLTLINDAAGFRDTSLIPPVPPLRRSDTDIVGDVFETNESMLYLCDRISSQEMGTNVYPWLHIYLDQGALHPDSNVTQKVVKTLENRIQPEYRGLALTISRYDLIWKHGIEGEFERFINSINNICEENHLPIACPRSEWYGAYLTDFDINIFSSLMRKQQQYSDQSPGGPGAVERYSSVPDIEHGSYLNILDLDERLSNNGELADFEGLANAPKNYPHHSDELLKNLISEEDEYEYMYQAIKDRFGTDSHHRKNFGKPRWLTYIELAERFRNARRNGLLSPAKRHLDGSDHPHLS